MTKESGVTQFKEYIQKMISEGHMWDLYYVDIPDEILPPILREVFFVECYDCDKPFYSLENDSGSSELSCLLLAELLVTGKISTKEVIHILKSSIEEGYIDEDNINEIFDCILAQENSMEDILMWRLSL